MLQVYISEISCAHLRGRLSSCLKIFSHAGLLTSYLLGAWLDWRQLALVCGAAPLMLLVSRKSHHRSIKITVSSSMILITTQLQVTTQYTPESPSHLVYCGKLDQAARSLQWLRGDAVDVSRELATIQINVQRSRQEKVNVIPIVKLIR